MVAVAYRRWSFIRGFNSKEFGWENFGVLDWGSLMGDDRLREVVAHGGSHCILVVHKLFRKFRL